MYSRIFASMLFLRSSGLVWSRTNEKSSGSIYVLYAGRVRLFGREALVLAPDRPPDDEREEAEQDGVGEDRAGDHDGIVLGIGGTTGEQDREQARGQPALRSTD